MSIVATSSNNGKTAIAVGFIGALINLFQGPIIALISPLLMLSGRNLHDPPVFFGGILIGLYAFTVITSILLAIGYYGLYLRYRHQFLLVGAIFIASFNVFMIITSVFAIYSLILETFMVVFRELFLIVISIILLIALLSIAERSVSTTYTRFGALGVGLAITNEIINLVVTLRNEFLILLIGSFMIALIGQITIMLFFFIEWRGHPVSTGDSQDIW